jgi:hypothetical protein
MDLEELWVSDALLDEVERHPRLSALGPSKELEFDGDGVLTLAQAVRR